MIRKVLESVLAGEHLSVTTAHAVMNFIMNGEATPAQIAAFTVGMRMKGETVIEIAGFVRAMRDHMVTISVDDPNTVDGCGTGGDGAHTLNISTAAAIVASAAGCTVAKHGNRSVSSKCGSADLLEACGANIDSGVESVEKVINQTGFGFMFAPRFHPAMKYAAGPRRELGIRTFFNVLGPMTNPAGVKRQVIGVYDPLLMELMSEVLRMTGSEHVIVAHSQDGLDEFSVSGRTDYVELKDGKLQRDSISACDVGLAEHPLTELIGGEAAENHRRLHTLLDGETGAYRDCVILNAAAMIYVAGKAASIADGVAKASEAIDSGAGKDKLAHWIAATLRS
ncbi:MAG: anthranilate phosphoribosyltransferase [Candidatus Zixiibacteriota bacterium]